MRAAAEGMKDLTARELMLRIAAEYENLAEQAQRRVQPEPLPRQPALRLP